MLKPLKVATPATAATVVVPPNVPPPTLVPMASVTLEVSVVTVLLLASCTVTPGCAAPGLPASPASWLGRECQLRRRTRRDVECAAGRIGQRTVRGGQG